MHYQTVLWLLKGYTQEVCASQVGPIHHCQALCSSVWVDHMMDPVMSDLLTLWRKWRCVCGGVTNRGEIFVSEKS